MKELKLQSNLVGDKTELVPLQPTDFERLFLVASEPLIWEQHPQQDRYKLDVFKKYFDGALESMGALLIKDRSSGEVLGSTRYYFVPHEPNLVHIGYTFFARKCWGHGINSEVKRLMLDHVFQYVDVVAFEVGVKNIRSQIAVQRLGATEVGRYNKNYVDSSGEVISYRLPKSAWNS